MNIMEIIREYRWYFLQFGKEEADKFLEEEVPVEIMADFQACFDENGDLVEEDGSVFLWNLPPNHPMLAIREAEKLAREAIPPQI